MNRKACLLFVVFALAASVGCSSKQSAESKKANTAPDRIQGKAQVLIENLGASDAALNAGGSSVYIWQGKTRYRLFLRTPTEITHGSEYVVEGVVAQKVIDDMGDPDQGKNGYPLRASCERVVKTAWPGLAFDAVDTQAEVLRVRVKRYPARPVFLVTRIRPAAAGEKTATEEPKKEEATAPEVTVPAEKQRALLIEAPPAQTAPLWDPAGGTVSCDVSIGTDGKIAELQTGKQLCEAVDWAKFAYKPLVQKGRPVKVSTAVEVRFEARK